MTTITTGSIPTQSMVENEILALRQHISDYRVALNQEGIWLFLATLGCWSVTKIIIQTVAFFLAAILFGDRLKKRFVETKSFSKRITEIKEHIFCSSPEGDFRKARLYDLAELQKNELSTLNSLKNTWVFFLCWLFWGGSLFHASFHIY